MLLLKIFAIGPFYQNLLEQFFEIYVGWETLPKSIGVSSSFTKVPAFLTVSPGDSPGDRCMLGLELKNLDFSTRSRSEIAISQLLI